MLDEKKISLVVTYSSARKRALKELIYALYTNADMNGYVKLRISDFHMSAKSLNALFQELMQFHITIQNKANDDYSTMCFLGSYVINEEDGLVVAYINNNRNYLLDFIL